MLLLNVVHFHLLYQRLYLSTCSRDEAVLLPEIKNTRTICDKNK
jgi:hypothetical protein